MDFKSGLSSIFYCIALLQIQLQLISCIQPSSGNTCDNDYDPNVTAYRANVVQGNWFRKKAALLKFGVDNGTAVYLRNTANYLQIDVADPLNKQKRVDVTGGPLPPGTYVLRSLRIYFNCKPGGTTGTTYEGKGEPIEINEFYVDSRYDCVEKALNTSHVAWVKVLVGVKDGPDNLQYNKFQKLVSELKNPNSQVKSNISNIILWYTPPQPPNSYYYYFQGKYEYQLSPNEYGPGPQKKKLTQQGPVLMQNVHKDRYISKKQMDNSLCTLKGNNNKQLNSLVPGNLNQGKVKATYLSGKIVGQFKNE